jgi:hypothetical protein
MTNDKDPIYRTCTLVSILDGKYNLILSINKFTMGKQFPVSVAFTLARKIEAN